MACDQTARGCISRPLSSECCPKKWAVPLRQRVATPHVVHQDVKAPVLLAPDTLEERAHLVRLGVVGAQGDAVAAGGG